MRSLVLIIVFLLYLNYSSLTTGVCVCSCAGVCECVCAGVCVCVCVCAGVYVGVRLVCV